MEHMKLNIYRNKRGMVVTNGHVLSIISGSTPASPSNEDINEPNFDRNFHEVFAEVEAMRLIGTLQPFTEGEPIGMIPRQVHSKELTPKQLTKTHNERMEQHREDMLQLRAHNDATLIALINWRF